MFVIEYDLHQKQIILWWCQCVMVITTKRVGDEFLVENYVWSMTERCRFSIIISICLVNSSSSIVWRHLCKIISQNFYILWHKTPEAPTLVSQKCLSSPLTFGDAFILLHRVNIDKGFLVLNSGRLLKCDCSWRNGESRRFLVCN